MPRDKSEGAALVEAPRETAPVLAVGLGRGSSGKSTGLAELIWRAKSKGRLPIIADGDAYQSATLSKLFPGQVTAPETDEMPDVKEWLTKEVLSPMVREGRSAV